MGGWFGFVPSFQPLQPQEFQSCWPEHCQTSDNTVKQTQAESSGVNLVQLLGHLFAQAICVQLPRTEVDTHPLLSGTTNLRLRGEPLHSDLYSFAGKSCEVLKGNNFFIYHVSSRHIGYWDPG